MVGHLHREPRPGKPRVNGAVIVSGDEVAKGKTRPLSNLSGILRKRGWVLQAVMIHSGTTKGLSAVVSASPAMERGASAGTARQQTPPCETLRAQKERCEVRLVGRWLWCQKAAVRSSEPSSTKQNAPIYPCGGALFTASGDQEGRSTGNPSSSTSTTSSDIQRGRRDRLDVLEAQGFAQRDLLGRELPVRGADTGQEH